MANTNYARGASKERLLCTILTHRDYVACRVAGSRGTFDVAAFKPGYTLLYQVKSGHSPFGSFGPAEREEFKAEAAKAGAIPWLAWFPKGSNTPQEIPACDWPQPKELIVSA